MGFRRMTRLNVPYRSSPLAACMWLMSIWYCAVSMATVNVRLKPFGACQSSLLTLPVKSFMSPPSAISRIIVGNINKDSCGTRLQSPLNLEHPHTTGSRVCQKMVLYAQQNSSSALGHGCNLCMPTTLAMPPHAVAARQSQHIPYMGGNPCLCMQ